MIIAGRFVTITKLEVTQIFIEAEWFLLIMHLNILIRKNIQPTHTYILSESAYSYWRRWFAVGDGVGEG